MSIRVPGTAGSTALATPSTNGLMPSGDKAKVDALGTVATHATTEFALVGDPAAAISTHDGNTGAHGQTAAGRALLVAANVAAQLAALGAAPLASPGLTGTPTAPTPAAGTNTTQLATTAFVLAALQAVIGMAPATLDTLAEIAAQIVSDESTVAALANTVATKAPLASPALTGTPTAPTAAAGTNTTQVATTAFIIAAIAALAPLASPAFTGTPTVPTAAGGTNTTQAASTAFVTGALGGVAPLASPSFTGTPAVPTAPASTNTTQAASTAFVQAAVNAIALIAEVPLGRSKAGTTIDYSVSGIEAGSLSTAGPGANTLRYAAVKIDTAITIDALICEVQTAGSSGTTIRMGIYAADLNWQPTGNVLADSGQVVASTTGVKVATLGTALTVQPGRYLTVITSDSSSVQCRAARGGSALAGYDPGMGTSAFIAGWTIARAYAALPASALAWDTKITSSAPLVQMVFFRITAP